MPARDGLSRRTFLVRGARATVGLAGIGGLTGLAGCGGSRGGNSLDRLARDVSGPVVVPGDRGYAHAKLLFNPAFDAKRPRAVVFCRTPEDVSATVEFARRERLPLAARSGGHSFGGYSAPNGGIVADVSRMNRMQVAPDRRTALVGPGVLNIDNYANLGRGLQSRAATARPSAWEA